MDINVKDNGWRDNSALCCRVRKNIIKSLVGERNMNVNEQSSRGTVLRIEALRGNLDIVEWLNEGNADVYVTNISGLTAFDQDDYYPQVREYLAEWMASHPRA